MPESLPDIESLFNQLDAAERDARSLVNGLSEVQGSWRADPASWSVAQCLDHLATTNQVYLGAMQQPAIRARAAGRLRRRPALPGFLGRWFAGTMEPPVNPSTKPSFKLKSPEKIKPAPSPALADAFIRFLAAHDQVRNYLSTNAGLDLAAIRFPNPLASGIRFSLATGLHVITAHERRHLAQAWQVRRAVETVEAAAH